MSCPDWSSPLGRLVRRLDLDPNCNCLPPVEHVPGCLFYYRSDNKRCSCRIDFSRLCPHVLAGGVPLSEAEYLAFRDDYTADGCRMPPGDWLDVLLEAREGLSPASLERLLCVFDPEGMMDRRCAARQIFNLHHDAKVKAMALRVDKGLSPFHPLDGSAFDEDEPHVAIQAERGCVEGELATPMPTAAELGLLAACEERIRPAWLTWPWLRGGRMFLAAAGRALMQIRDGRLYRGKWLSFRDYHVEAWGFLVADVAAMLEAGGGV